MKPVQLTEQEFENIQRGLPLNHGIDKSVRSVQVSKVTSKPKSHHALERMAMSILHQVLSGKIT